MTGDSRDRDSDRFTRRQFLTYHLVVEERAPVWQAIEAVATTAMEHPEWDMDEEMTWTEWRLALLEGRES